jgi:hypothetical protein
VMYSDLSEVQFLDGSHGGIVKVVELVAELNEIKSKVNSLISYINAHTHASNGTPPTPYGGGTLSDTTREDIENENVTHGDV